MSYRSGPPSRTSSPPPRPGTCATRDGVYGTRSQRCSGTPMGVSSRSFAPLRVRCDAPPWVARVRSGSPVPQWASVCDRSLLCACDAMHPYGAYAFAGVRLYPNGGQFAISFAPLRARSDELPQNPEACPPEKRYGPVCDQVRGVPRNATGVKRHRSCVLPLHSGAGGNIVAVNSAARGTADVVVRRATSCSPCWSSRASGAATDLCSSSRTGGGGPSQRVRPTVAGRSQAAF